MKKIAIALSMILMSTCFVHAQDGKQCDPEKEKPIKKNTKAKNKNSYGTSITKEDAVDVSLLPDKMKSEKEMPVKIKGKVAAVCQVKGCWMTTDLGNGKNMRIRFKDYAFFVPKNCDGKQFYAQGVVSWNTTSVGQLQHYAEDAGKSPEEIAKITEPVNELVFLAEGVIIE